MNANFTSKLLIAAFCGLACAPTFAASTFIVENRTGGLNVGNFTQSGWATSSGNVNAPGCTLNIGSYYSPAGTSFGPSRYAQFSYAPTTTGFYQIDLAWTLGAAESDSAVNLYTGAATGGPMDQWGNAGGPAGVIVHGTMNMYNNGTSGTGAGTWRNFTTAQLSSGTTYKVGVYAGHVAVSPENRAVSGAVRFMAATPTIGAYGGPANGATGIALTGAGNNLSWAAGNYDSFFDVYLDTSATPTTKVGSNLSGTTLSFDPDSLNLLGGTTYYWEVVSKNVDVTTPGAIYSFTTVVVPEPSTAVLSLLGGLGMMAWISRRRTA